jgi:acetyltransferase-like isoleucine patch superfamily enzyme
MIVLKIIRKIRLAFVSAAGRFVLRIAGVATEPGARIGGIPYIYIGRGAAIRLGRNVSLSGRIESNPLCQCRRVVLVAGPNAIIKVGNNCSFSCATLYAECSIELGDHVGVGAGARIFDSDFHSLDFEARRQSQTDIPKVAPVRIEDDVWIGADATILKGVTVGRGAVIAAGAVVTSDVPAFALYAGVPAKAIRSLMPSS